MRDQRDMRASSTLRFLGTVVVLVLVFGSCGSLLLGAFDRTQMQSTAPLLNLGNLFHFVTQFLGEAFGILTTYTDANGVPFHSYLLQGAATTIEFCFLAMPMALLIGLLLALMSRSRLRILRAPARGYVEFFRNTPLLVQMLAIYSSLLFLPQQFLNAFTAGVTTLVLNYAAYECENLRAGIAALDRGQGEAGEALGLSYWQTLRLIIIPQTVTIVLPPVINDLIYMYKDSSILSLITIHELTYQGRYLSIRYPIWQWQFLLLVGGVYLVLSLPGARFARAVEARLKSVTFVPRRNLTGVAVQVLIAVAAFGWLCGLLVDGVSVGNAVNDLGQLLAAVTLAVGAVVFSLVVLGSILLLAVGLLGLVRRRTPVGPKRSDGTALATMSR
jgi:glutamine transport system permease protein